MSTLNHRKEGMALLLALIAILMIGGAVAIVMGNVYSAKRSTDSAVNQAVLEEACKAGIDIGIQQIWNAYTSGRGNTTGNLASYRVFIENLVDNNEDMNGNGYKDGNEQDWNGDGSFEVGQPVNLISQEQPRLLPGGASITNLRLSRTDDVTGCTLTITATAQKEADTRTAVQTLRVSGARFAGFQYAILANNINCILCHADVYNGEQRRNTDPNNYGTFDRVKVAALESLLIRPSEADSRVAGSVYTRGKVYDSHASLLSASAIANSSFDSYRFSSDNGKIEQNAGTGAMSTANLANAGTDADGKPNQFGNLYLEYPSDRDYMTDGELPTYFPAPFPDDNGDRYVNPEEFEKYVNSADGAIQFELPPEQVGGQITAGVAYGVPEGSQYTGTALPTASNDALQQLSTDGSYDGNLILVGTQYDPIVINDKVAIDGDLIIKGPIKGRGQLLVSGNVYVVGDVTYADAAGKFGEAVDGTENAFALNAGGNILLGDYLTIRAKNNYKTGNVLDPDVWQGKFIRVDKEHYNVKLSDTTRTTAVGYFDTGVVDAGVPQGQEGQYSFTTAELTLFNRLERQKWAPPGHPDHNPAEYIPDYTPRYYRLRDGAPIYQYVSSEVTDHTNLDEHAVNYFSPGVEVIPEDDLGDAAVLSLNPQDNWISEDSLRRFWFADEAARRAISGRNPFKFDGLLYTNNCIFGVIRSYTRHFSDTYGTMNMRGGIVCADLGVLMIDTNYKTTTGFVMDYDKRVDAFLNVEDPTQVTFARLAFRFDQDA